MRRRGRSGDVAALRRELEARQAELDAAHAVRQRLEEELEGRRIALEQSSSMLAARQAELEAVVAERARVEARLRAEGRRREDLASQMELALGQVKGDLERLGRSRTWRWGHGLARLARRLTFRREITEGAVAAALQRIEAIEDRRRALSMVAEPVQLVEPPRAPRPELGPGEPPSFCIKLGADAGSGERALAEAVRRELERKGHRCLLQVLDEWDASEDFAYDVALHVKGTARHTPAPGRFNVLWSISHPEMLTGAACDGYDLVCVASEPFAERLGTQTQTPVVTIEQATDPDVFFPEHDPAFAHELVFVGDAREAMGRILRDLLPTDRDLAVFGGHWEGWIDERHVRSEAVPNGDLRKVYSSAGIVLHDHWDDMREHGFVSRGIYDALACGAFVISDHVPELSRRFEGAVQTYETPEELRRLVERYAGAAEERRELARRGRELVLERHTFAHRVDELLAAVRLRWRTS
jgi:hypothetical protein